MASETEVRWFCDYCKGMSEKTTRGGRPKGWKRIEITIRFQIVGEVDTGKGPKLFEGDVCPSCYDHIRKKVKEVKPFTDPRFEGFRKEEE